MSAQPLALAAAVTPLLDDNGGVDLDSIPPLALFYSRGNLDGILVLGTTGEGVLLPLESRRRAAEEFIRSAPQGLSVFVHCGAQSTRDTALLSEHASVVGAAGVAVIAPPYFAFDERSLLHHFTVAAAACAPTPFFVYEFAQRSGYEVPLGVLAGLRESAPNFSGLKVSDSPFDAVQPYILPGLDVFIGSEELIDAGIAAGAAGAVSGLAAALPEFTVAAVHSATPEAARRAGEVRRAVQRFPFQAALKRILQMRGVALGSAVTAPLRDLDDAESSELQAFFETIAGELSQSTAVSTTGEPSKRSSRSGVRSNVVQR